MRKVMSMLAAAALMQGLGTANEIRPDYDMGSNPYYMPTRSRRVKNKLARLRKTR
jgi:hypothetical protein